MAGKKGKADSKSQSKGKPESAAAPAKKKGAQAISARHILCDKFSQREEALAELRDGKDWKEVCVKYSTEKARSGEHDTIAGLCGFPSLPFRPHPNFHFSGGDLGGYKQKGSLQPEFEEVAFAMETADEHKAAVKGEKEPMKSYNYGTCKTVFGYHIILLEGKK